MGFVDSTIHILLLSSFLLFACGSGADIKKKAMRCHHEGGNISALPDPLCTATVIAAQCSCAMPQPELQEKPETFRFPFASCIDLRWKAQQTTVWQLSGNTSKVQGTGEVVGETIPAEMYSTTCRVEARDKVCGTYPTQKINDDKTGCSCRGYLKMANSRFVNAPNTKYTTSKPNANCSKNDIGNRWRFCKNICRGSFGCNYTLKIEETFNLAAQSLRRRETFLRHWVPSFNERHTQHLNIGALYLFGAHKIWQGFPQYQLCSSLSTRLLSELRNGLPFKCSNDVPTRPTPGHSRHGNTSAATIRASGGSLAATRGLSFSVYFFFIVCLTTCTWQK